MSLKKQTNLGNSTTCENIFDISSKINVNDITDHSNSDTLFNEYILFPNYPNPFYPNTKINYQIPQISLVKMTILDALGKEVSVLINEKIVEKGLHQVTWDAKSNEGGEYLLFMRAKSLQTEREYSTVQKMILHK